MCFYNFETFCELLIRPDMPEAVADLEGAQQACTP